MPGRKYFLDLSDLQFKQVRLPLKSKLIRVLLWFIASVAATVFYSIIFQNVLGSPEEQLLNQEIENLKLKYSLMGREIDYSSRVMRNLELSDENRYRPVLDLDSIPESFRRMGTGGTKKYDELEGYNNSALMVSYLKKVEELRNRTTIQYESFKDIETAKNEWKREMEYLPFISPVNVIYRLGDGVKFREVHPVFGTPQWHHGQDFRTPYGTEVYATGSGKVVEAGWKGGHGNYIMIDHGYGFRSSYSHLSNIRVTVGLNVKRGDKIGLTGSTGTSSGPHLHYQILLYGQYKNPLYYFNDDLTSDEYFEMIQTLTSQAKFK